MNQFETYVKLNVHPLGSYDVLIGMDWLEQHRVVLNCFDKTFTCINNEGETVTIIGIPSKIASGKIFAFELKRFFRKGCKYFVVTVINEEHINNEYN